MPTVNDVEHLRKWLRGCPALSADNRFRVDYMSEGPTEYALYSTPATINHRENVLGEFIPTDVQALTFVFASKQPFGADEEQNIRNHGFYQDVINWIIEQNSTRNLPDISEGRVLSVAPTLTAYVSEPGASSAKYQIQLKLTYRRN